MIKIGFTMCVSALALAGCATVKNNYVPETEQISVPPLNETTTVSLGEDMLRQGTAVTTKGVVLPQQNKIGGYTLSPGFYPQTGEDAEYIFTSFAVNSLDPDMGRLSMSGGFSYPQGIRFDKSQQKTCLIVQNMYGFSQPACDTEYPYRMDEMPIYSKNSFQQTLIYSGRVGDKVKISYREFSGNMARGAFTNEAEYDLSTSDEIAYKGARIKVIKADNQSIEYIVLSNFNLRP